MPSSKRKKCRLNSPKIPLPAGYLFNRFGHQWTVQSNGTATADIHVDFHEVEVAAGRYVVVDKSPSEKYNDQAEEKVKVFGEDPLTYYGCETYKGFKSKFSYQTVGTMRKFALDRFNIVPSFSLTKSELIKEIMTLVRQAHADANKNETLPKPQINIKEKEAKASDETDSGSSEDKTKTVETKENFTGKLR